MLRKWRNISTEELCKETKTMSIQQIIACSTMTTAVKIVKTQRPVYLHSKFVRNERSTAFLQPRRKQYSCEGFINRSISLLNRFGMSELDSLTESNYKKKIKSWVQTNISVKPKVSNPRFGKIREAKAEDTQEAAQMNNSQPKITNFFSRRQ